MRREPVGAERRTIACERTNRTQWHARVGHQSRLPPGALAGRHVDLETLWGRCAHELRDKLCSAPTAERRFQILENALSARLSRPFRRHAAVQVALDELGRGTAVGEIVARVGLSHRRFVEVFSAEVGLTPKSFGRIQRFRRASALTRGQTSPAWSRIAASCGYFDQSHLIRDFMAFTGFSPAAYLRHALSLVKEDHLPPLAEQGSLESLGTYLLLEEGAAHDRHHRIRIHRIRIPRHGPLPSP